MGVISLWILTGCGMFSGPKLYPLSDGSVVVKGDKIYQDGILFAELRYFTDRFIITPGSGYTRGFGIYYYSYDKEIWIYPKQGWCVTRNGKKYRKIQEVDQAYEEHTDIWEDYVTGVIKHTDEWATCRLCDRDYDVKSISSATHIRISKDGKYVYYWANAFIWPSPRKYDIERGTSKRRFPPL